MSNTADNWLDRRILRRRLGFWRIAAILLAVIAGIAAWFAATGGMPGRATSPHIAKIRIEGTINENEKLMALIADAAEADAVKGVILAIDSPGGSTAGGEAIYESVRGLAAKKPTVAQVGTLAASAGYMIAAATDHIVARQTSIVGSIGVLFQYPDLSQLLNSAGIKVETIKSSPLKAEPNFFNPASEDAKSMIRRMIMDSYDWFVAIVDDRRPLDRTQTLALADGSVFTGRQALANKLVDSLGGEEAAVTWLKTKGIAADLKVIEWKPDTQSVQSWFGATMKAFLFRHLGLEGVDPAKNLLMLQDQLFHRGLVSRWDVDSSGSGRN